MRVLLCRLDGVPEDEAEEVRELLRAHRVDHYETPGGLWGISVAGIWLPDEEELPRARQLLESYQATRAADARAAYARHPAATDSLRPRRHRRDPLLLDPPLFPARPLRRLTPPGVYLVRLMKSRGSRSGSRSTRSTTL